MKSCNQDFVYFILAWLNYHSENVIAALFQQQIKEA